MNDGIEAFDVPCRHVSDVELEFGDARIIRGEEFAAPVEEGVQACDCVAVLEQRRG
jgi:hypothetical protein